MRRRTTRAAPRKSSARPRAGGPRLALEGQRDAEAKQELERDGDERETSVTSQRVSRSAVARQNT